VIVLSCPVGLTFVSGFSRDTEHRVREMETKSPRPGCLVLGLDGLVDTVDIEEQRKRRFVSLLHPRYFYELGP